MWVHLLQDYKWQKTSGRGSGICTQVWSAFFDQDNQFGEALLAAQGDDEAEKQLLKTLELDRATLVITC